MLQGFKVHLTTYAYDVFSGVSLGEYWTKACRLEFRTFHYQALALWNQLPLQVREADTESVSKTRLKLFLLIRLIINVGTGLPVVVLL